MHCFGQGKHAIECKELKKKDQAVMQLMKLSWENLRNLGSSKRRAAKSVWQVFLLDKSEKKKGLFHEHDIDIASQCGFGLAVVC